MEKIAISNATHTRLSDLLDALINEGYFYIFENAEEYVNDIYNFIYTLPEQQKYNVQNTKYGAFYCRYKANAHTTYYIIFDIIAEVYYVNYILNNHTHEYVIYIKGK